MDQITPEQISKKKAISWEQWREAIETFGILVAATAMVFTGYQANIARTAFVQSSWNEIGAMMMEVDRAFLDYPEIRPYFEDKLPVQRGDNNYHRVMAMADLHLDFFDTFEDEWVKSLPEMDEDGEYMRAWREYIINSFLDSPALRWRFSEAKDEYVTKGFIAECFEDAEKKIAESITTD